MRTLAIDQGTSSTKAVVFDAGSGIVAEVDVPVGGQRLDGAAVEQDPLALWASVVAAGRSALDAAGHPDGDGIDCVGIGNQGETVLAWDRRTGEPLSTALVWQDRRAVTVTDRLAHHAERLLALTGLPLDPYFAAPKMTWLRESLLADGVAGPHVAVTTVDAWVLFRLTGQWATDATTASRTMLLDLTRRDWSGEACAVFGLAADAQPPVVANDADLGGTAQFGRMLPVTAAVVDQQAALFAQDCRRPGDTKCTYGTGAFLLTDVGGEPRVSRSGLATSVGRVLSDGSAAYCVDGQVYTVGAAVSWLERVGVIGGAADLDRLGGAADGTGGAVFVPSLAGVGAPVWAPEARAAFTGLGLGTSREQLVRAFVEGIAAQVTMLGRTVEQDLGVRLTALRADGGLTRSRVLMQEQADLLGVPVEVYPHACATALGVAAFALRGRFGPGAEDSVLAEWSPSAVYEPALSVDEAESRYHRWVRALQATLGEADGPAGG